MIVQTFGPTHDTPHSSVAPETTTGFPATPFLIETTTGFPAALEPVASQKVTVGQDMASSSSVPEITRPCPGTPFFTTAIAPLEVLEVR